MPAKSLEQKAIEKQMKESQRRERDNARHERVSGIVNAAKYIGDFRVMVRCGEGFRNRIRTV